MNCMEGIPSIIHDNDYVFMVVHRFSKMDILTPCKKSITTKATTILFLDHLWVHFRLPRIIISYKDSKFLSTLLSIPWSMMETKLTKSTILHPQTYGQLELVNRMMCMS